MAGRTLALAVALLLAGPAAAQQAAPPGPAQQPPAPAPGAPVYTARGPRVNADAKLMAEFDARVKAYAAMHRAQEATLPDLSSEATPQQIDTHQRALAQLVARARAGAQPGDLFHRDTRALFRRYLARVLAGPRGAALRALIMDENPGRLPLPINGRYPDTLPVVTVPPQVLETLPKLPDELEYRFAGTTLVLLDVHAHLVVDVIESAVPR